jgi:menaquinone-specific isochorismate synthase
MNPQEVELSRGFVRPGDVPRGFARAAIVDELARGLAIAARSEGITCIALRAPVVDAARIVEAFEARPIAATEAAGDDAPSIGETQAIAAWTSGDEVVAGVGIAVELRGSGANRWDQVVAAARAVRFAGAVVAGVATGIDVLGAARPRFLGGAAFAPGAADAAPWRGFGDAWFALPRWTYIHERRSAWLVLAVDGAAAADVARWRAQLVRFRAAFAAPAVERAQPAVCEVRPAPAAAWRNQILAITAAIAGGACAKVVAARTTELRFASLLSPAGALGALDDRHADCVRVLVRPPGAGALVAATPERLVRVDGDVVTCDALAGTARRNGDAGLARVCRELLASTKDRWEHALVVDAIRDALVDAGALVDAPAEPTVRVLRHVAHLHTPFRARLREPRHLLDLAARLHPTPAMGGTPTDVAVGWISSREPAPRGWYASPVGWFDRDGNGELAVAIRTGVLDGDRAFLWAGGGIVGASDPDRELAETDLKFRAMLQALGVAPTSDGTRPIAASESGAPARTER